ncbi:uncharacterized protein LOC106650452 [Trichogramma pretiosum]|uniref:uncharacterized protein LOC106650452 n=1 Tax=Trichogramma pretiosum TaxID=7493 RepID=UPI0006C9C5A4|nr:uncharacterized protein LOC106650452 [Trichogramma pretiosum]
MVNEDANCLKSTREKNTGAYAEFISNFNFENPIEWVTITGYDGVVYRVSKKREDGRTMIVTLGPDGEPLLHVVTITKQEKEKSETMLTPDNEDHKVVGGMGVYEIVTPQVIQGDEGENDNQIEAQVILADEPSSEGIRRVLFKRSNGEFMLSEVDEEQYAALELDKQTS